MTDIKTAKFIKTSKVNHKEFAVLLYGLATKVEFKNKIESNNTISAGLEWSEYILNENSNEAELKLKKYFKAKELIQDIERRIQEDTFRSEYQDLQRSKGNKEYSIKTVVIDTASDELFNEQTYDIEKTIHIINFSDFFDYYCQEYETDSELYADWIYPLLDKPIPSRYQDIESKTVILDGKEMQREELFKSYSPDEYVLIQKLPKLLQLAIKTHKEFDWDKQDLSTQKGRNDFNKSARNYLSKTAKALKIPHSDPNKSGDFGISNTTTNAFVMAIKPDFE